MAKALRRQRFLPRIECVVFFQEEANMLGHRESFFLPAEIRRVRERDMVRERFFFALGRDPSGLSRRRCIVLATLRLRVFLTIPIRHKPAKNHEQQMSQSGAEQIMKRAPYCWRFHVVQLKSLSLVNTWLIK